LPESTSLDPPLQPLEPGSYDFARDLFFQGSAPPALCAARSKSSLHQAPRGRCSAPMRSCNACATRSTRAFAPCFPAIGAIAAMLIDGRRDTIATNVYDALFVSGIGHVLSISGYHMAVVAGLIFFVVRAFFALIPGLADRAPIKKWAALAALMVTGFYLAL